MKKILKRIKLAALGLISALCVALPVQAAGTELFYYPSTNSQGAWTLPVQSGLRIWNKKGDIVEYENVNLRILTADPGQHFYYVEKTGDIRVYKWEVCWVPHKCVHHRQAENARGLTFYESVCSGTLSSGWWPICADCGQSVKINFYSSQNDIKKVTTIPTGSFYYSICPLCGGVEQGCEVVHFCREVSPNRYFIIYDANGGIGYMADSAHYVDNATTYEGKEVTATPTLSPNRYNKTGFYFAGWNTERDGSGEWYKDKDKVWWSASSSYIKNKVLSSSNETEITLYAQWKPAS